MGETWFHPDVPLFPVKGEGPRPAFFPSPTAKGASPIFCTSRRFFTRNRPKESWAWSACLKWLRQQRDPESPRLEEHQLRLESDANAVRIVTIHKSKGLEYPVVFCPFNWDGSRIGEKEEFLFHDAKDDWKLNLVLNPEDNPNRMLAEKEILAENLRLLYVSLTRAKNRCYLVWGRFNEAGTSAPAYLLHPPDGSPEDIVEATGEKFEGLTDADIRQALKELARNAKGAIQLSDMPLGPGEQQLPAAEAGRGPGFSGILRPYKTRLANCELFAFDCQTGRKKPKPQVHAAIDLPDYDQGINLEETIPSQEPSGIFAFPKGARPGTLLHDIFETNRFFRKGYILNQGGCGRQTQGVWL